MQQFHTMYKLLPDQPPSRGSHPLLSLCFGNTDRAKLQVNLTQCQLLDLILGLQKLFTEKQPIQIIYFIHLPLDPKKDMIMTKTWILL